MSMYGRYYRPALKNSVDVQLQTAFNEGLWSNVVRLAAQRFKAKKDPYYEVGHQQTRVSSKTPGHLLMWKHRQYGSARSPSWTR